MKRILIKGLSSNTTTKPTPIVIFAIIIAVASVSYVLALAILAPEQLAEATAAATDLVCSGCVGTSDIADSAVTSAKIGSGQVGTSDIASSAVTSAKIGSGQVGTSDIATNAVTTGKISDTAGVQSVDIVNGQVASADIGDGQVTAPDIADNAVTSSKIADGAVTAADIGDNQVGNSEIADGAVTGPKIADETITYADVSHSFVAIEHRDDCNCGGTGWDPDGTGSIEFIYDDRITTNSVVSVTIRDNRGILCGTTNLGDRVMVLCDHNIFDGMGINYAIFNP